MNALGRITSDDEFLPSLTDWSSASTPEVPILYADEDEDDEPTFGGGAVVRTVRIEEGAAQPAHVSAHDCFKVRAGGCSDVGAKLTRNEDAMLLLEEHCLYVVADGMGGHAGGEIASRLAVDAIAAVHLETPSPSLVLSNIPPTAMDLIQGFAAANEAIRSTASRTPELSEMGTTVVAARVCPRTGQVHVAHVGDSRCYRLRDGVLEQITEDHTMAAFGLTGRDGRRLSRAVGTNGIVEADVAVLSARAGDSFILCSDGLTKALKLEVLVEVLTVEPDPCSAARELVARAKAAGAGDNVTVVAIKLVESPSIPPPL